MEEGVGEEGCRGEGSSEVGCYLRDSAAQRCLPSGTFLTSLNLFSVFSFFFFFFNF